MRTRLHRIECEEGDVLDIPDRWTPVRLEHNGYVTPPRKGDTHYDLERA